MYMKRVDRAKACLLKLEISQHALLSCRSFAQTVAEALLLCRKLCDYNVGRLLHQPTPELAKTCEKFRLSSLLTAQGASLATDVLVDLLKKHAPSGRLPVSLSDEMLHGCPTYFPYRQQVYLQVWLKLIASPRYCIIYVFSIIYRGPECFMLRGCESYVMLVHSCSMLSKKPDSGSIVAVLG
jgi:hypothetical protein